MIIKKIYGVQLIPLEKCLHSYFDKSDSGHIYYRKLYCSRTKIFHNNFANACKKAYGKVYDILPQDWIKAELNLDFGNVQRENTFWCSALVSYMYVKLGLLAENLPWTLIAPNQYSYYEKHQINFQCQLEPEVEIKLF